MDLIQWALIHLEPSGITLEEAKIDAASATFAPERYASAGALSALWRLRAAITATPVATAAYAPLLPPTSPVTVASEPGGKVRILTDTQSRVAPVGDAPRVLHALGLDTRACITPSLIVDTPTTLARLLSAARADFRCPASPVIDYYDRRAEHPGTGMTYIASSLPSLRYVAGVAPRTRLDLDDWAALLGLPRTDRATTALAVTRTVTAGPILPGLIGPFTSEDTYTWTRLGDGLRNHQWRHPDSRQDATNGLTSTCHSAELYASLRLGDPLIAEAETRTGTVITGTITDTADKGRTLSIEADRPICRHKVGADLCGWLGTPAEAGHSYSKPDQPTIDTLLPLRAAFLDHSTLTSDGTLTLHLRGASYARTTTPSTWQIGQAVTLRSRLTDPYQQARTRKALARKLRRRDNWLTHRDRLYVQTRQVPWDVALAAAGD